jgi:hypothetical protein
MSLIDSASFYNDDLIGESLDIDELESSIVFDFIGILVLFYLCLLLRVDNDDILFRSSRSSIPTLDK